MADNIIKENQLINDFVKTHCTDILYTKIANELSERKQGTRGSRKLGLTPEILRVFIYHVSTGKKLKVAAFLSGIEEKTRQDYKAKSQTFSGLVELAEQNVEAASMEAVYKSIVGTKPGYYELTNPITQKKEYIPIKEVPPNVTVAQWYLEKKKYFGDDGASGQPQLGAPRNEEEAKLLEFVLNRHHDYIASKSTGNGD